MFPLPSPTDVFVSDTAPVSAGYQLGSNGTVSIFENGAETIIGKWIDPNVSASSYSVTATLFSGSVSGPTGSPVSLGTTRTWSVQAFSPGSSQACQLIIDIQLTSGPGPIVATANVGLDATYL